MSVVVLLYLLLGGVVQSPLMEGEDQCRLEMQVHDRVWERYLNLMLQTFHQEINCLSQRASAEVMLWWSWEECTWRTLTRRHGYWFLGVGLVLCGLVFWGLCGLIFWGLCFRRRRWKKEVLVDTVVYRVQGQVDEDGSEGGREADTNSEMETEAETEVDTMAEHEKEANAEPEVDTMAEQMLTDQLKVTSKWGVGGSGRDSCFVQGVVEHLLDVARGSSQLCSDVLQEGCLGVGSQFEGCWNSGRQQDSDFDMLVVISPPYAFSFHVELGYSETSNPLAWVPPTDYHGEGRVRLMRVFPPSLGMSPRPCELKSSVEWMVPGEYLEPALVLQWLGSVLKKSWGQRKTMKVSFGEAVCPCRLRVENPSGQSLWVNLVPAVRVEGTDVFLVTQGPVLRPPDQWSQCFSVDEGNFLRDVTQRMASDSCHLKCLRMLSLANTQPVSRSPTVPFSSFLTSNHLKTVLLFMLSVWPKPQFWTEGQLAVRLQDALDLLRRHLEHKQLFHFAVWTRALGLRQEFSQTSPINLFEPLKQDPNLHMVAMKDLERLTARLSPFTQTSEVQT